MKASGIHPSETHHNLWLPLTVAGGLVSPGVSGSSADQVANDFTGKETAKNRGHVADGSDG